MVGIVPIWKQFERLTQRILELHEFKIRKYEVRGDAGYDLEATLGSDRWAIEVKFYRTSRAQTALIEAAATRLMRNAGISETTKGMLVVSCILPTELRQVLEGIFSVTFIDRIDLKSLASTSPKLVEELEALLETEVSSVFELYQLRKDPLSHARPLNALPAPPAESQGTTLCTELREVEKGKKGWKVYEATCEKVLRYLFPSDLYGWHPQKRTDDGLNRYDFVCRVRPTTEFWRFVIEHLDSRYVLFEFKNYSGKIKQGQILTTEKYLLQRGLRRVAVIFSRSGADSHAIAMAQGAMREQGKLMLILDDDAICQMLHMKESGSDPSDCLFDLADEFLLRLPR